MRFGLDFGGVIVRPTDGGPPLDPTAGAELVMPGAFDAITELVSMSGGNAWIVSKASPPTQKATRLWLGKVGFYQRTGLAPSNICFCAKREDKARICSDLTLTHFVDDRKDVLQHMVGIVPNLIHFGSRTFPTWKEIMAMIRAQG
jgi:hypothetical protein